VIWAASPRANFQAQPVLRDGRDAVPESILLRKPFTVDWRSVLRRVLALVLLLTLSGGAALPVLAQEPIPPVQVGGGQSATRVTNGQTVEVSTSSGVAVIVYFNEISSTQVTGVAVRASSGQTAGTVTIRWVNRGRETTLQISPAQPEVPFGMEGGDVDKRSGRVGE
jgi:hypothetical protein